MLNITINSQPNDETCGPTSLHAIYRYYGLDISLETVIAEVERSVSGGTLASLLGKHALSLNFDVTIYINNLRLFDPSWFWFEHDDNEFLIKKIQNQRPYQEDPSLLQASLATESFLKMGGKLKFKTITAQLLKKYFDQETPIITGLSATYLYRSPRERFDENSKSIFDDIRGLPCGHFVVLSGYDEKKRSVVVADPHRENPISGDNYYKVSVTRLINAIMLGVLTYDANLLIIKPKEK
jgi:hypothetical protein